MILKKAVTVAAIDLTYSASAMHGNRQSTNNRINTLQMNRRLDPLLDPITRRDNDSAMTQYLMTRTQRKELILARKTKHIRIDLCPTLNRRAWNKNTLI